MKKIYTLSFLIILFSSCNDWLDINQDPNNPLKENVSKDLLLSYVQNTMNRFQVAASSSTSGYFSSSEAVYMNNLAQHLTKSGDYSGTYVYLTGLIMPQNTDAIWDNAYELIANLRTIKEKAIEDEDPGYEAIAIALMVQNFQKMVDIFNNVPYSEGGLGEEFIAPRYENGADIYQSLIQECDEAVQKIDQALSTPNYSTTNLSTSDITAQGNLSLWRRYIRTIQLGLLMRISYVEDVSSKVNAIKDECLDIYENIKANPGYYKETNKMNPLYESWGFNSLDNTSTNWRQYKPTTALVDFLRDNDDPRLRVYISPRNRLGDQPEAVYSKYGLENEYYVGVPFGQMAPPSGNYESGIAIGILGGSSSFVDGPTHSLTVKTGAEVGFFLAEAALRGIIPGGDVAARQYYEDAVISAISRHETAMQDDNYHYTGEVRPPITVSGVEAGREYINQQNKLINWELMNTDEEKFAAIQTQKWVSLFCVNPFEAWSEQRRTDYPKLGRSVSIANGNKIIARLPYPNKERNLNTAQVQAQGEIDVYESLVFWDRVNEYAPETPIYQ